MVGCIRDLLSTDSCSKVSSSAPWLPWAWLALEEQANLAWIASFAAAKSNQKDRQCLANKNKAVLKLNPFLYKPQPYEINRCDSQEHGTGVLESGRSGSTGRRKRSWRGDGMEGLS